MDEMTIDEQVNIAIAVKAYLRAKETLNDALEHEREAKQAMQEITAEHHAFVVKADYRNWLIRLNANAGAGFTIEPIDVI